MSAKFSVGDRVLNSGYVGIIRRVIQVGPTKYKYRVEFEYNTLTLAESSLKRT